MSKGIIGSLRVHLGLDSAQFQNGLKNATKGLQNLASSVKTALAGFAGAFAAGIGVAVHRVEQMEVASRKLDRALENSGNAARTSAREIEKWASELQRRTGRASQEVMDIGANLASFNFGEEVFFRAIELADDMSAAWGGDLRNNLEGLSRALDDPIAGFAMLRKRGISLTDAQAKMVKGFIDANDKLGAQKVVLEALEEQVKGVAEAGYGGMTKALGNLRSALADFFDRIVKSVGGGTMLADAIGRITAAIDKLTENLGTVAVAASIAGTGLALAFSPALIAAIWGTAAALTKGVLAALIAINAAILANPLTALILAFTAAITAAYVFRDEVQKAIGVDVIGIVQNAANYVINSFRAAFEDIKFVWSNFGNVMGAAVVGGVNIAIKAINSLLTSAKVALNDFIDVINMMPGVQIGRFDITGDPIAEIFNPYARRLEGALTDHNARIAEIMASNPIGELGKMFELSEPDLKKIPTALGEALDEAGGKADKNAKRIAEAYKRIIAGAQEFIASQQLEASLLGMSEQAAQALRYEFDLLNDAKRAGVTITDAVRERLKGLAVMMATAEQGAKKLREAFDFAKDTAKGFFTDLTQGIRNGEGLWKSFANAAVSALDKITNKLLDMALDEVINGFLRRLLGGMGSMGGGTSFFSSAPGISLHNLPSFDGGGFTGRGSRSGGWDGRGGFPALLHPNETVVDHTRGGGAHGSSVLEVHLSPDLIGQILQQAEGQSVRISQQTTREGLASYDRGRQKRYQAGGQFA